MVRGQAWAPWAVQCLGFYVKAVLCLALGPSGYMVNIPLIYGKYPTVYGKYPTVYGKSPIDI